MPIGFHRRACALGSALAVLALSLPARASVLPPEPGDPAPVAQGPTYSLPPELELAEGIDLAVQTDPGLAEWFETFMFDFDEGCWEEFGETSGPMSLDPGITWKEEHTRWMGEFVLNEALPELPYLNAFEPADPDATVVFEPSPWLLDLKAEELDPVELVAPPAMIYEPLAPSNYPVTGFMIDTRYWDEGAAAEFEGCLFDAYQETAIAYANATGMLVSAIPVGLPDAETITTCYEQMESLWGDPCLPADDALCINFDWHDSWCGRRAYDLDGADPGWICNQAIDDAIDEYVAQTGATEEPLLLPETTFHQGTALDHEGLVHASGVKIQVSPDAAYGESNMYSSTATNDLGPALAEALQRDAWQANGLEVHSCREYAYERYLDMSELQWAARDHQGEVRWIFDAAFYGADGVGPYVTPVPTKPDFRGSDGNKIWLNFGYGPDDGFVPWSRSDRFAIEEYRRRHRLFATAAPGWPHETRLSTFKNVYFYLHRLRKGPTGDVPGGCDGWKDQLRGHYTVNTAWHHIMDDTAKQAGFLDDELERMRRKQDDLWEVYLSYLASDDASERQQLTAQIDQALHEGYDAGCIPLDPSVPTPCDWAPSLFVEGMMADLEYWRTHDYEECVAELGDGTFDDADLHAKFVDVSGAGVALLSPWDTLVEDARNVALGHHYTGSPNQLRAYFVDMLGIFSSWGYRELLGIAIGAMGDRALIKSSDYEKTMGGEFFGVSMRHQSAASAGVEPHKACTMAPGMDGLEAITMRLGPFNKEFYKGVTNLIDNGTVVGPGGPDPNYQPWAFDQSFWVSGELTYEPGQGTTLTTGVGWNVGWSIGYNYAIPLASLGWAELKLRLGASGSATASIGVTASRTWLDTGDVVPQATPEELAMNGGVPVCDAVHSTSVVFSVNPGVRASGTVALGVSLAKVLEVGVKGTLTLISLSLPISYTLSTNNNNPEREPRADNDLRVDLVLELLSGTISIYVALDAIVTLIPIWELVIAKWHVRRYDVGLQNDTLVGGNVCVTSELAIIGKKTVGTESDPCPCRLRPPDCHG